LDETNNDLTKDLSLKDILDAISSLPKGKVLGCDGIPTKFFQECAREIAPTLIKAFTNMFNLRETSTQIKKGIITLIPKSREHSKLSNWRPITLLGSLYKILAKTLARRLQAFLPNIVRPN
jgi:hypothetical protein